MTPSPPLPASGAQPGTATPTRETADAKAAKRARERVALQAMFDATPAYVDFESALWGASKVLLLLREQSP